VHEEVSLDLAVQSDPDNELFRGSFGAGGEDCCGQNDKEDGETGEII